MSEHIGHHVVKAGSERSFGVVFAIVFAFIAIWPLFSNGELRIWSLLVAAVFFVLALIAPRLLRPLNIIWFKLGLLLGRIISPIVISILFFIAVTPTALIMRMLRKDLLNLKLDPGARTYWISRSKTNNPMGSMKNQF